MATKAICGRLQKLEQEISELVAQHLKDFQKGKEKQDKSAKSCRNRVEKKRSSSAPARANTKNDEEATSSCTPKHQNNCSCPSSRKNSPHRAQRKTHAAPKESLITKPPNEEPKAKTCKGTMKRVCKCCQGKSVQFSSCSPKKTYTVEELFKTCGRISSISQQNDMCSRDFAAKEEIKEDILGDTLNIQKTLFQVPCLNQTLQAFDSYNCLQEKLKNLEKENKRLNTCLEEEARLKNAFIEKATREIKKTEGIMDEKIAEIQQKALGSVQQLTEINKNLMATLCDRENCLRKMSAATEKLKNEQQKSRCRCKFASNVCQKLRERNDELEKEKMKFFEEIENATAENEQLRRDLEGFEHDMNCLKQELNEMKKEKVQLQDAFNQTVRKAESQQIDLKRKNEIENELNKLTNLLRKTEQEREQLYVLVGELKETIASQKERLEELTRLNEEQDILLKSQKAALDSKDEQIRLTEAETAIVKRNSLALEQKLVQTEETIKHSKDSVKDLEKAWREIAELKDTILMKEKIINDQAETLTTIRNESERNAGHVKRLRNDIEIKDLEINRRKRECENHAALLQKAQQEAALLAEEFRKATSKTSESIMQVKRMSVELESQNAQKQALLDSIEALNQENQKLRNQVTDLEEKLENVCHYSSAGDMERQQLLITYLEQQVALQQREWEIQKKVINKEKSKALQTAKFATKKLLETVKDFQRQTEMQRRVHVMLTNMLQDKEEKLLKITSKMGSNKISILPKIEGAQLREVHEICKREYRVPDVRRSIYSPTSDLTVGDSHHDYMLNEEDEESIHVPSNTRLLPVEVQEDEEVYENRAKDKKRDYLSRFCDQEGGIPEEPCVCCECDRLPCQCSLSKRRYIK